MGLGGDLVGRTGSWNGDRILIKAGRGHGGVGFGHRRADAAARWVDRRTGLDRQRVPEEVPWVNVGHVFLLSEGERES